jgi:predicted Zn-dependent protease
MRHKTNLTFIGGWRLCLAAVMPITLLLTIFALPLSQARAEKDAGRGPRLNIIRDAEIEDGLKRMALPILRVAGLDPAAVRFVLVQDPALNAFVAGGMNVFLYTGLIQKTESPDELIGVMAHELGHIAGGHLVRGTEALRNASYEAILGMVAGVAIGVLAGDTRAAAATIGGTQELAARSFFSFSRTQEGSADAAAMRFLDQAGWSAQGLLSFMQKLQGQEYLPTARQSEYVRTHPVTMDRISALQNHLSSKSVAGRALPAELTELHARIKAKLLGYLQPESALLRFTAKDPAVTARYARAIALYRQGRLPDALTAIDALLVTEPENPYFHELRGQMLFENSRVAEAVESLKRAAKGVPDSALPNTALGQALLQLKTTVSDTEAIAAFEQAVKLEPNMGAAWRGLATGWGRNAEDNQSARGLADYALAEEAMANGEQSQAVQLAERALKNLPDASPYRLRAQDIKLLKDKKR